jgi:hypothetical protein
MGQNHLDAKLLLADVICPLAALVSETNRRARVGSLRQEVGNNMADKAVAAHRSQPRGRVSSMDPANGRRDSSE